MLEQQGACATWAQPYPHARRADGTAMTGDDRGALEDLADVLWAERHLVEYLLFKLVTANLLLAAEERRFVPKAMDEVERVMQRLSDVESRREAALLPLARRWGVAADELSLAALATRAEEPMATVFGDLHREFLSLTAEIEQTSAENRRMANSALNHMHSALDTLTGPTIASTYTAKGTHDVGVTNPLRLDRAL